MPVVFETDPREASKLREALSADNHRYYGKVVRDRIALQLILRRAQPDAFVINLDCDVAIELIREFRAPVGGSSRARWIGLIPAGTNENTIQETLAAHHIELDAVIRQPSDGHELFTALDSAFQQSADVGREPHEAVLANV